MYRLRTRYDRFSFRGRLLLLLVAVSLIQVSVAAYTFFQLQSKPAEQRIQAQLDSALAGMAPVIDSELERASARLKELTADPALQSAIENEDWATAESLLGIDDAAADPFVDGAPSDPLDPLAGDAGSIDPTLDTSGADATEDAGDSTPAEPALAAYVTDDAGEVVVGTRPDGALVDREKLTSSRLFRDTELLATVHVPVVIDRDFLQSRIVAAGYVPKGIDVFVADDEHLVTTASDSEDARARPKRMREGLGELEIGGEEQVALVQPLLDGSIVVGASVPASVAAAQKREGLSALWGFIALLAFLMVGMSFFITRAVSDALRRFAEIARDLARGQLHRRIPVTGEDEVAVLSSSFNEMAENLEDRIARLVDARARMRRQVDLFGEALANATDIDEMLQAVCSLAMESAGATHARFWTLDDEGRYEHAACVGLRPGDTEPCGLEKAVPVRNAPVLGEGEPHWLVVPARMRDGQIVGLLTLVSTGDAFSDDDVRIAERIGVQAAVAIDNARMHEQLRLQATRDGLTGLPNHRTLQDELAKRIEEAYAKQMPLGVCMLDIDNFKRVNDTYGHPIGDEAIKAIGRTLAHGIGGMGTVGRFGGEEFVVIMPGCDGDTAWRIADRLREDITRIEVPLDDGTILRVTSSFGVANLDQQHDGVRVDNAELLHQADVGMYNSKRTGKNRVTLAGPDTVAIEMSEVEKAKLEARERGDVAAEHAAAQSLETNQPEPAPYDPFDLAA